MERIIDGILFEGKVLDDTWNVTVWESANGHRETSARRAVAWQEIGPVTMPMSWDEYIAAAESEEERNVRVAMRDAEVLEKQARARLRNAKRAKTTCRRKIKTAAFDELLTITYRENQTDIELFKRHFKEWVRRMRKALGGSFAYVSGFEPQERGAWHAHVSCHKLPKHAVFQKVKIAAWRLGTEVWRSIVGKDNGLVFVGGKTPMGLPRRARMTCAKMAAYVSKYITKHAELFPAEKNRYSSSEGIEPGKPYTMTFTGVQTVFGVLGLAFDCRDGESVVSHQAHSAREGYWLVTEQDNPLSVDQPSSIYRVPRATCETALAAWNRAAGQLF